MDGSEPTDEVVLSLPPAEALVLFEFLARESRRDVGELRIQDQAEQRVLWDLESRLESALSEPLRPDYEELVKKARDAIRDSES